MEALNPRKGGSHASTKYPSELRQLAQRLVAGARTEDRDLSLNQAVPRIDPRVEANPDTLISPRAPAGRAVVIASDTTRDAPRAEFADLFRSRDAMITGAAVGVATLARALSPLTAL